MRKTSGASPTDLVTYHDVKFIAFITMVPMVALRPRCSLSIKAEVRKKDGNNETEKNPNSTF